MHVLIQFFIGCVTEKLLSYLSTKAYCVGTQKKRLYETVLLSYQTYTTRLNKKTFTIFLFL